MVHICKMERKNWKIQCILKTIIMKKTILYFLGLSIAILLASCTGIYEDGSELAADLKSQVKSISVKELKGKIDKGEDFFLIDIRQEGEYYTENIPGSVLIPRGVLEFTIMDEEYWMEQYMYPPEKDSEIIIYCKSEKRGVLAAIVLAQLGFTNVKNLEGGYDAFNPNQDPNAKSNKPTGGCGG
jgi:rhodanese-related sulfurtransferase